MIFVFCFVAKKTAKTKSGQKVTIRLPKYIVNANASRNSDDNHFTQASDSDDEIMSTRGKCCLIFIFVIRSIYQISFLNIPYYTDGCRRDPLESHEVICLKSDVG